MNEAPTFLFHPGTTPLLVSVPHDGRRVPQEMEAPMTPVARTLPDTDWHVAELYDFCREIGASMIIAQYSRYVVDLNRSDEDEALYSGKVSTGLCPAQTFAGDSIYLDGRTIDTAEREARVREYWRPYHDRLRACLDALTARHGYALLWDAHSIPSRVPRLFDGQLPALNIGTNGGRSCPHAIEYAVAEVANRSTFTTVVNGRFRGGYITRRYGGPDVGCYAIQLELAQRCYMDEGTLRYDPELASTLIDTLRQMLRAFIDTAANVTKAAHEKTNGNS